MIRFKKLFLLLVIMMLSVVIIGCKGKEEVFNEEFHGYFFRIYKDFDGYNQIALTAFAYFGDWEEEENVIVIQNRELENMRYIFDTMNNLYALADDITTTCYIFTNSVHYGSACFYPIEDLRNEVPFQRIIEIEEKS